MMIGLQAVDRIEALHKIGYIHRDIKPDNLLIGPDGLEKTIYLIDFGLSKRINESRSSSQKNQAVGTLGYMSCRAHLGLEETPADDMEALVYTLIYLMCGTLPWMKVKVNGPQDIHRIKIMKENIKK